MNSIRKGKSFERLCAKLLTKATGATWRRVPQSGAMATLSKDLTDNRFKGDLFCEDKTFSKFVVECKVTNKKITLSDFFNNNSILWKWWDQAKKQAGIPEEVEDESQITESDHIPLLIFKISGSNDIYLMYYEEHDSYIYLYLLSGIGICLDDVASISRNRSRDGIELVDLIRIPKEKISRLLKSNKGGKHE